MGVVPTRRILVANWKQSGRRNETLDWVNILSHEHKHLNGNIQIIVCPPLKALDLVAHTLHIKSLPIAVGVQDVDLHLFEGEKNTGEVGPSLLADSATYAIIGHSETRRNRNLTDNDVAQKVTLAQQYGLDPIICVSELEQVRTLQGHHPDFNGIIAYEPLFAIGTGNPDTPENANNIAKEIKKNFPQVSILYGGSVDGNNVGGFLQQEYITGALVGNRSLDGSFFLEIVKNAQ